MNDVAIKTMAVTKWYGDKCVLRAVNLEFKAGKIYGVLGRNGAGKTTLVNIITNRGFTTSGSVSIAGKNWYESDFAQQKVFCITEKSAYPTTEKVKNLIKWAARFYPSFDTEYAFYLAKKFDLDTEKSIKKLSTGYSTITKVILTLASNAPFMIFDEPVLGIDAIYREVFYAELLKKHAELKNCMVLSTHIMDEVERVLTDIIILKKGIVVFNATKEELPENQSLQEYYLNLHKTDDIEFPFVGGDKGVVRQQKIKQKLPKTAKVDPKKIGHSLRYFTYITWPQAAIIGALLFIFTLVTSVTNAAMATEIMIISNVLLMGVMLHGLYFKYSLYNGVSRKTYSISLSIFLLATCFVTALLGTVSITIQFFASGWVGLVGMLYGITSFGFSTSITMFIWLFAANLLVAFLGLLGMVLFQTLARRGRFISLAAVVATALIIMFWGLFASSSLASVLLFLLGAGAVFSQWFSTMWLVIFAAIFATASLVLIQKTEVK